MVLTRFALILYFRMVTHKAACQTLSKAFLDIDKDMVQILLMFEVLFPQDSKVEYLFCGAPSSSKLSLFFSNYLISLGFKPIQDDFQYDFARMTDEADRSVVLAELKSMLRITFSQQRSIIQWIICIVEFIRLSLKNR